MTNDQVEKRTEVPIFPSTEEVQTLEGTEDLKNKKNPKEGSLVSSGGQPSKTALPSVQASKVATPTPGFSLKTTGSRKKRILIEVDMPSPPSSALDALEVEAQMRSPSL
ncbi:hypothetical protein AMTR_s00081p00147250 [Amborella trichopoda]|uniref:Uncharacterized protein n=1 Tax=Amborella trichopoda TaxID=13333 RepID=W1PA05_AMBTC|nr:hypothetical protein AMTR_s00081p00147250 [Amborella trichopoda]